MKVGEWAKAANLCSQAAQRWSGASVTEAMYVAGPQSRARKAFRWT